MESCEEIENWQSILRLGEIHVQIVFEIGEEFECSERDGMRLVGEEEVGAGGRETQGEAQRGREIHRWHPLQGGWRTRRSSPENEAEESEECVNDAAPRVAGQGRRPATLSFCNCSCYRIVPVTESWHLRFEKFDLDVLGWLLDDCIPCFPHDCWSIQQLRRYAPLSQAKWQSNSPEAESFHAKACLLYELSSRHNDYCLLHHSFLSLASFLNYGVFLIIKHTIQITGSKRVFHHFLFIH